MQAQREKGYLKTLRSRKQIVPNPDGGEKLLSGLRLGVRFPTSLKTKQPEDWPEDFRIYMNM